MRLLRTVRVIAALAALSVLVASCSSPTSALPTDGQVTQSDSGLAAALDALAIRYPPRIRNEFGVTSTSAYGRVATGSLRDSPYKFDGNSVTYEFSYAAVDSVEELAAQSRLVVTGTVEGIGAPHFNSTDGGFWHYKLVDLKGYADVANDIFRDVVFRVDAVVGQAGGETVREGALITFAIRGGEVEVTLGDKDAQAIGLSSGGTYVFSSPPEVNLKVGEQALLFLDWEMIDGYYNGSYGEKSTLSPVHDLYYKYSVDGSEVANVFDDALSVSLSNLESTVANTLGSLAGPPPSDEIMPKEPHEVGGDTGDVSEPDHTHGEGANATD